ncbi:MAG: hypothetical protein ACJA0Q_000262 [Saprospiraceae bacterium]|jgi:hypothetical protein
MKSISLLTIFLCSFFYQAHCQSSTYEIPIYFNQYFNDPQVNSNNFRQDDKAVFSLGHKRNTNNFGGVTTSIFSLQYKLKEKSEKGKSVIGCQFMGDKEGFLIRRNRFLASYARHLKMSSTFNVAGGLALGFYNFLIKGDGSYQGSSAFAFDAAFLLKVYSGHSNFQFSVNQATNSSITPVQQDIILGRSYNLFASHRFVVGRQLEITPNVMNRYSKEQSAPLSGYLFGGGSQFLFSSIFMTGLNYEHKNGFNFSAGFKKIKILNSELEFDLSYFVPNSTNTGSNIQTFELFVRYLLNVKNK